MSVSVIVATRNSARYLAEALSSLRAQQGVTAELVVVDKESIDGTPEIVHGFGGRLVPQKDDGLSSAWNTGIEAATGDFIAILDSDDLLEPGTLADRVALARQTGDVTMGMVLYFGEGPRPSSLKPELFVEPRLAPIPGTLIFPRRVLNDVGPFDPTYAIVADGDWVGRAMDAGHAFRPFERLVLRKRIHGDNLSMLAAETTAEILKLVRRKIGAGRARGSAVLR